MGPFEQLIGPVETHLAGNAGEVQSFEQLSHEQRVLVTEMIRSAETADIYNALQRSAEAINRLGNVLGGIDSEDIAIEVDPESGRSHWSLSQKARDEVAQQAGEAELGEAAKEFMVYQRLADVDGVAQYGFDYVRSVAMTEE